MRLCIAKFNERSSRGYSTQVDESASAEHTQMRRSVTVAACSLALLACCAASTPAPSLRDQQVKLARGYVAALHSKEKARIEDFFHPAVRACINDKTRSFYDYIVAQQLQGMPSSDYSKITITKVGPKNTPIIWAFVPAKGFPYPVMPTYDVQLDFQSAPNDMLTDMLEVAPSGTSWYLVMPCPNAYGLAYMRDMQARSDRQRAKAKQLASAVHGALLAQIKQLLAHDDTFGAAQAYQKATGSDLSTAVTVIDVLNNQKP
jgi:hypothetical protein